MGTKSTRRTATIRDVAEKAGVSISTVSHVLNGTRRVGESARGRVLDAITELDYRPNQMARGLRGAETATLGLIISDIREEFFSEITKAIESAANERGYAVVLCDSEEDVAKEALYIETLAAKGVDGIIIAPVDSSVPPRQPRGGRLPIVQIDRLCPAAGLDFAGIDNRKHAAAVVRHFHSSGLGAMGFVGHENSIWTMGERAEGFSLAMRELGHEDGGRRLVLASRGDNPKAVVRRWLMANLDLEALICGNANIFFTVLETLDELEMGVARPLSLAAFDDLECFRFLRHQVVAIRQPIARMGLAALDMLMQRMKGEGPEAPREMIFPARLMLRDTASA
ncbi:MAG TPA: LacI family DNA-binding transcriptional regulator [Rectinemataceae bacterium]|nr:LacI family DNA-binding transcriptional regulator [Rectinemataceae bacterium]